MTNRKREALIQMALRGTEYEKKLALKLVDKYGIDLVIDKLEMCAFEYKTKYTEKLLYQIFGSYRTEDRDIELFRRKGRRKTILAKLYPYEVIEIRLRYSLYKKALEDQMNITYDAFIQANNIFSIVGKVSDKPLTEQDKEMLRRAETISRTKIHTQLEEA